MQIRLPSLKSGQIVFLVQKDVQCSETYAKKKSDFYLILVFNKFLIFNFWLIFQTKFFYEKLSFAPISFKLRSANGTAYENDFFSS